MEETLNQARLERREKRVGRLCRVRTACLLLSLLLLGLFIPLHIKAAQDETADLLDAADSFFKEMRLKAYPGIWKGLTGKSRKTIAEQVYKAIEKTGDKTYTVGLVEQDFNLGGAIARSYWDAYLDNLQVDYILDQSVWEIGFIRKDKAEICLLYKKSANPARLKMFKEQGRWKVGLIETFGSGK